MIAPRQCRSVIRVVAVCCALSALSGAATARLHAQDATASTDANAQKFVVASWNLEWLFDDHQGDNFSDLAKEQSAPSREEWEWKRNVVATAIAKLKPDVIALQEIENQRVLFYLTRQLRAAHDLRYRVGFVEGHDYFTEQDVGVLYRSDLVEVGRWEATSSEFADKSLYNINKHHFAKFLVGRGEHREVVTLVNLHLRARAEQAPRRRAQARQLNVWLSRLPLEQQRRLIVLGDFNTEQRFGVVSAEPAEVDLLISRETKDRNDDLVDLHAMIPANQRSTHLTGGQFDRILIGGGLAKRAGERAGPMTIESVRVAKEVNVRGGSADKTHWEESPYWSIPQRERDVSDHYPVVATFRIH